MTYKPELDGLRAFALFLVLLTHMELAGIKGGFVGVDVFFVLSGYLITTIIVNDIEKGRFGFAGFFGRRIMRLYPAFLFIMFVTFVAYFLLTDPETFRVMARSARYVLFSVGNIFFDNNLGYFDAAAQKQGLLHTWSLGIEWQFYLVWPFIIWGAMKFSGNNRRVLFGVILTIVIVSLIASEWAVHNDLKGAYYLIQNRAFELGLGGLLMYVYDRDVSPKQGVLLFATGIITLLLLSFVFYHYQMKFPGLAGLVPCFAAAACMMGSKAFTKGNFLRWPWMVYIGKSSYSIYLVHWPLLVLTKYYLYRSLFIYERIALVVISITLGCLVFATIETHINWRSIKNKRLGCALMVGLTIALLIPMQHASRSGQGWPWRLGDKAQTFSAAYIASGTPSKLALSHFGAPDGKQIAYMMGDSFTAHYYAGFQNTLIPENKRIDTFYIFGCFVSPAYADILGEPRPFRNQCMQLYKEGIAAVNKGGLPLILSQDWLHYYTKELLGARPDNPFASEEAYLQFLEMHLATVKKDIGNNPLIILSEPHYYRFDFNILDCVWRPSFFPQVCEKQAYAPYAARDTFTGRINQRLKDFAQKNAGVSFIDLTPITCPNGICALETDIPLYNDGRHFSRHGSEKVITEIWPELDGILEGKSQPMVR